MMFHPMNTKKKELQIISNEFYWKNDLLEVTGIKI